MKIFPSSERYITEANIPLYSEKNVLNLQAEVVSTTIERVLTVFSFGWPFGIRHRTCEKLLNKRNRFSSIVRHLSASLLFYAILQTISFLIVSSVLFYSCYFRGNIYILSTVLSFRFNPLLQPFRNLEKEIPSENVDYLRSLYFASVLKNLS